MKWFLLALFFPILFGCQPNSKFEVPQTAQAPVEKTPESIEQEKIAEVSLDNLTDKQKKKLDEDLSLKVRKFLDDAEEIEILAHIDRNNKQMKILGFGVSPNTVAKITDASSKKTILDNFYFDTAIGFGAAACWSPRHILRAISKGKTFGISICYDCNSYKGSSPFGEIYGTLNHEESKSLILLNRALENYGVELK